MKRILYIIFISFLCLTGCSQVNHEPDNPEIEEKAELATVSEQVVYEDKHISITVKESIIGFLSLGSSRVFLNNL